jgi:hypothetical protein
MSIVLVILVLLINLSVDAEINNHLETVNLEINAQSDVTIGDFFAGKILFHNPTDSKVEIELVLSLQADGILYNQPAPDPVLGTDHSLGAHSWTEIEDRIIAENTLTDGVAYTAAESPHRKNYWNFIDQFVELDRVREITALGWKSGDANWIWKVDVSASIDGNEFFPIQELQTIDMQKKWGEQKFRSFKPFRAKVIQFRYHNQEQKMTLVRMPSAIHVWDGKDDESYEIPAIGLESSRLTLNETIPPQSRLERTYTFPTKATTGQYTLFALLRHGDDLQLYSRSIFVKPERLNDIGEHSRFGVNSAKSSLAEEHRKLGIGWVRFENFKWPMVSPSRDEYAFDGTVKPWHVNHDSIMAEYRKASLNILPMMFLTPTWAYEENQTISPRMIHSQVPKDYTKFGDFVFQSVARYGSQSIDSTLLKTKDALSGLNQIRYFEIGNEPNLNPLKEDGKPPTYGSWSGTMAQWWEMFRYGAEAVKKADPSAQVVSTGFAGMNSERVDQLRSTHYKDGRCPLDFVDVVSVHYYSGRTAPEIATNDANNATESNVLFVEHLKRLVEWRDRYKPGIPIWMTETGYDTDGPIGTNEWTQAARLPRVVALCLANGIDKVFVYRESGSNPTMHASAGLLRNDFSRRPSWYTYATLIRQLHNAHAGYHLPVKNKNLWLQSWQRDNDTIVMANTISGEEMLGIEFGECAITDAFGRIQNVQSSKDYKITEFPIYISEISNKHVLNQLTSNARSQKKKRTQQRQRDAQTLMYLYNFGNPSTPIAINFGRIRYYQSVPANSLFTKEQGYGFIENLPRKDDFKHYFKNDIEKYGVTVQQDQTFRCIVEPGQYEIRFNAQPLGYKAECLLEGIQQEPVSFSFTKGEKETIVQTISVSESVLDIKVSSPILLRWFVVKKL